MARPHWIEVSYSDMKAQIAARYHTKTTLRRYWLEEFIEKAWVTYRQRNYIQTSNRASKDTIAKLYIAWIKFNDDIVNSVQEQIQKYTNSN